MAETVCCSRRALTAICVAAYAQQREREREREREKELHQGRDHSRGRLDTRARDSLLTSDVLSTSRAESLESPRVHLPTSPESTEWTRCVIARERSQRISVKMTFRENDS